MRRDPANAGAERIDHSVVAPDTTAPATEGALEGRYRTLTCGLLIEIDNDHEFIQGTIARTGVFEPGVTTVLTRLLGAGDLFVDVGANIGHHTLVAASRGAAVHAFEPVPRLAERIRRNAALNRLESPIYVIEAALSNREGNGELYVAARSDDGSHSLLPGVEATQIDSIRVRLTTLDRHLVDHGNRAPAVVKIDVEGYEAAVLDGARHTLDGFPYACWLIETGDRLSDQLGECAASVLDRFFARGYRVFRIADSPVALLEIERGRTTRQLSDYLAIHRSSPRLTSVESLIVDPAAGSHHQAWLSYIRLLEQDIASVIPGDQRFILIDEDRVRLELSLDAAAVPLPERDGAFWGLPSDGDAAVRDLERLRDAGAAFVVFVASSLWWLDHYVQLRAFVESRCTRVLENDRVCVYALSAPALRPC